MLASPLKFSRQDKIEWHLGSAGVGRNKTSWRWYNFFCFTNGHLEFLWMWFLSHLNNLNLDKFVSKMIDVIFCPPSVPIFWYFSFHAFHLCWSSYDCTKLIQLIDKIFFLCWSYAVSCKVVKCFRYEVN